MANILKYKFEKK